MKGLPEIPLPTTVVGSYPAVKTGGITGLLDPMRPAVKTAVEDQLKAGIDIISDGQVRGDMVRAFTSRLPGIRGQEVIGKVMPGSGTISVSDTKYALSKTGYVKGILTGPTTLSHALHISTPVYRDRGDLAMDLASVLASEAVALEEAGVCMVQIDEPIFSTGIADLQSGKKALSAIISKLGIPVCLHVCGDLSRVVDEILTIPVSILDFEFSNNPGNLELFGEKDLKGRMIGFGCLDSTSADVESIGTVMDRIESGIDVFGHEKMLLDPDCGLRMLSRESAYNKLSCMVAAAKNVRKDL